MLVFILIPLPGAHGLLPIVGNLTILYPRHVDDVMWRSFRGAGARPRTRNLVPHELIAQDSGLAPSARPGMTGYLLEGCVPD
jgi:hypothetical protein